MNQTSEWVSLGEAAAIIGVHPATIRNWAERGELPCQRTPGGHRRFRRADLYQWLEAHRLVHPTEAQLIVQNALGRTRLEIANREKLERLGWHAQLDEHARAIMRQQGLRLMDALIAHLAQPQASEALAIAEEIGRTYGDLLLRQKLSLTQALQGYSYFVEILLEAVIQLAESGVGRPGTPSWGDMLRQVFAFTQATLSGMVAVYECA